MVKSFTFVIMGFLVLQWESVLILKPMVTQLVAGGLKHRLCSANPGTNYVCHINWLLSVTFLSLVLFAISNKGLLFKKKKKGHHVFHANPNTQTSFTSSIVKASLTPTKKVLKSLLALILKTGS